LKLQAVATAEYLAGDEVIDLSHPSIKGLAGSLRAEHGDDMSFARAAFEYARDVVRHSWDVQDPRITLSASETLREGVGLCFAKAHLLTALLRTEGIPPGCATSGPPTTAPPSMSMGSWPSTCRAAGTGRIRVATSLASTRSSR
jgi:transglutaminase-like putative cysteine protease